MKQTEGKKNTVSPEDDVKEKNELLRKFSNLNDLDVAHSIITGELFKCGKAGEEAVIQKIDQIKKQNIKNDAFFRIAKLYYKNNNDIKSALEKVDKITDPDEQTRCLAHLACAVITKEGNLELADNIVSRAKEDKYDYLKYYKNERQKITDSLKKR